MPTLGFNTWHKEIPCPTSLVQGVNSKHNDHMVEKYMTKSSTKSRLTLPCMRSLMVRVTLSPPSITPESITTMSGREAGKTKGVFGHKDGSEGEERTGDSENCGEKV